MRIVAFILSVLVSSALLIGGNILVVVDDPGIRPGWLLAMSFALVVLVFGPVTIGSFAAYWDVSGSIESRRYFRRMSILVVGLEVVAAVVVGVYAAARPNGPMLAIVVVGGGAVLTGVAVLLGRALFRWDAARRPEPVAWVAIDPRQIRRRAIAVAATFAGVLVVGLLVLAIVGTGSSHRGSAGREVSLAFQFALFLSAFVCIFSTLGWNRRVREVAGRDVTRIRRIAKVVLRRKQIDLDDDDRTAAARYAAVISVTMSFQVAYFVLLYVGIGLELGTQVADGTGDAFAAGLIAFLAVVLAVLLPLQISRIVRARRYARDHRDLLEAAASADV